MPTSKPNNKFREILTSFRNSGMTYKADSTKSIKIDDKSFYTAALAEVPKGGEVMSGDNEKIVQATAKTQEVVPTPLKQAADKVQTAAGVEAEAASKVSEDLELEVENSRKKNFCSALNEVLSVNKGYADKISNFLKHWETWQQTLSSKLRGETELFIELLQGALAEFNKLNTHLEEQLGLGDANLIEKLDETKAIDGIKIAYTQLFPKLFNYLSAITILKNKNQTKLASIAEEIAKKFKAPIIEGSQQISPKTYFDNAMILPAQIGPRVPVTLDRVEKKAGDKENSDKIASVKIKVTNSLNNLNELMKKGDEAAHKQALLTLAEQNNFAPAFHNLGVMFIKDDPTTAQISFELAYYHATTNEQRDRALQRFQEAVKNNSNSRKSNDSLRLDFGAQLEQKKDELCKSAEGLALIGTIYNAKLQAMRTPDARMAVLQELKSLLMNVSQDYPILAEDCAGVVATLYLQAREPEQKFLEETITVIKQRSPGNLTSISALINDLPNKQELKDEDLLEIKRAVDTLHSLCSSQKLPVQKAQAIKKAQKHIGKLQGATDLYGQYCIRMFSRLSGLESLIVANTCDKNMQGTKMVEGSDEAVQEVRNEVDFIQSYLLRPDEREKVEVITAKLLAKEEALRDNEEWLERMDQAHSRLFAQDKTTVKSGFTRLTEGQIKFLVHGASKGHSLSLYTLGRALAKMGYHSAAKDYFKLAAYRTRTKDNQLRTTVLECYKQSIKEANGKNRHPPEHLKKQLGWSEAFSAQIDKNQNELTNDVDKDKASKASIRRAQVVLAELEAKTENKPLFSFFSKKEVAARPKLIEVQKLLLDAIGCSRTAEAVGQSLAVASELQKVALSPAEKEEVKSNIFVITSTFYNQINRMEENYTRSYGEAWRNGDEQAIKKIQAVKEAELSTLYQGVELLVKCWNLGRKDEAGTAKSQLPLVKEALMKARLDSKDTVLKQKAGELVDKVERFFPNEIKEIKECFVGVTR